MKKCPENAVRRPVSWSEICELVERLAHLVREEYDCEFYVVGIDRGGIVPGALLARMLNSPFANLECNSLATLPDHAGMLLLVDDIIDSGETMSRVDTLVKMQLSKIERYRFATLFLKKDSCFVPDFYGESVPDGIWLDFPWEMERKSPLVEGAVLFVMREDSDAILPTKAYGTDACYDLYVYRDVEILPRKNACVTLGVRVMVEEGWEAIIRGRSGWAKAGVQVHQGTIDPYYTGPCHVFVFNHSDTTQVIRKGDRMAQLAVRAIPRVTLVEVDQLDVPPEARGVAGIGSTRR